MKRGTLRDVRDPRPDRSPSLHTRVYRRVMGRTNVVVDDELILKVMRLYGLRTKREAIDLALRRVAGEDGDRGRNMRDMEGTGWEADLSELRRDRLSH